MTAEATGGGVREMELFIRNRHSEILIFLSLSSLTAQRYSPSPSLSPILLPAVGHRGIAGQEDRTGHMRLRGGQAV
jgi:hypothetical protein